ncbi:MAG: tetratricopeptide repeat protein [Bacteroidales bacterium]|nr:tetratricopeptide repeat protein [Bacteroidales bacterium]
METIRLFILIFLSYSLTAQDFNKLAEAFKKSYSYEAKNDYSSAAKVLKEVYDENSYEVNLRLGWISYLAGLFNESIAYYNKAMTLKPSSIEAKLGYVLPLSAMGNWDAVLKTYHEILKIDPFNSTVLYRTGLIYYNKADYSKAYKYFEKITNLYPFSYDGLLMFAWTNLKLGKYSESKILFQKVLLNNPNDPSALEGLKLIK